MKKKSEREYKDVFCEMSDRTMALASQVVGDAVRRGVSYRLACHAVRAAIYQGLFAAVVRGMKNEGLVSSSLNADEAFVRVRDHEQIGLQMVYMIFDQLQCLDRRHVWSLNVMKRELRPGEKPPQTAIPS